MTPQDTSEPITPTPEYDEHFHRIHHRPARSQLIPLLRKEDKELRGKVLLAMDRTKMSLNRSALRGNSQGRRREELLVQSAINCIRHELGLDDTTSRD